MLVPRPEWPALVSSCARAAPAAAGGRCCASPRRSTSPPCSPRSGASRCGATGSATAACASAAAPTTCRPTSRRSLRPRRHRALRRARAQPDRLPDRRGRSGGRRRDARRRSRPRWSRACATPLPCASVTTGTTPPTRAAAALALAGVPGRRGLRPGRSRSTSSATRSPLRSTSPTSIAREEHSVLLRRAAFDRFSTLAWRPGGRARARRARRRPPAVSVVLLATRREDMLDFALAQVARQRGVGSLELVLAPHGFTVDEARVRDAVGPGTSRCRWCRSAPPPGSATCSTRRSRAAGGDVVLKMDDDDWYAPDVVADLLRARAWSGAELVGMPAELHYLAERDLTVKRGHPVEVYATVRRRRHDARRPRRPARGRRLPRRAQVGRRPAHRVAAGDGRRDLPHPRPRLRAAPQRRPATPGRSTSTTCSTRPAPSRSGEGFRPSRLMELPHGG